MSLSVYDGIDVRYYGNQRQLEYDFIVAAGADAGEIRLRFEGVESATIDANGDLLLRVQGTDTDLRFKAPVSYQRGADGALQSVESSYRAGPMKERHRSSSTAPNAFDTSRIATCAIFPPTSLLARS